MPPNKRLAAGGGVRQQQEWAATTAEMGGRSQLAELLIDKWSWGFLSAPQVQEIAAAAVADGARRPDLEALAKLGSWGRHTSNIHSELMRKLGTTPVSVATSTMAVFLKKPPSMMTKAFHGVIWPHELFAAMYSGAPKEFEARLLGGSAENVPRFWSSMKEHPAYTELKQRPDHFTKCVPLGLHGDGVPVAGVGRAWSRSVDVYSWSSLLGKASTAFTQFLIMFFFRGLCIDLPNYDLFRSFSAKLRWSLYWLFVGVWPRRDENGQPYVAGTTAAVKAGQPLAGGFYGIVWALRADLDHHSKAYGLRHASSRQPCFLCKANSSDIPWTDTRPTALWRGTIWEDMTWKREHTDCHPLFTLPAVGMTAIIPDILHTLHLGCYQSFFGSVIKYLTHMRMPDTPQKNLEVVWARVKQWYQDIFCPLTL